MVLFHFTPTGYVVALGSNHDQSVFLLDEMVSSGIYCMNLTVYSAIRLGASSALRLQLLTVGEEIHNIAIGKEDWFLQTRGSARKQINFDDSQ